MEQLTKEQQKKIIRSDLKSMSYNDLIDLRQLIRESEIGIGDLSSYEYCNIITSVINKHKDCIFDNTGTYCGKYAKKRVYL